jgi:hypothetical protein
MSIGCWNRGPVTFEPQITQNQIGPANSDCAAVFLAKKLGYELDSAALRALGPGAGYGRGGRLAAEGG